MCPPLPVVEEPESVDDDSVGNTTFTPASRDPTSDDADNRRCVESASKQYLLLEGAKVRSSVLPRSGSL
jgi:hypothetical protein